MFPSAKTLAALLRYYVEHQDVERCWSVVNDMIVRMRFSFETNLCQALSIKFYIPIIPTLVQFFLKDAAKLKILLDFLQQSVFVDNVRQGIAVILARSKDHYGIVNFHVALTAAELYRDFVSPKSTFNGELFAAMLLREQITDAKDYVSARCLAPHEEIQIAMVRNVITLDVLTV